MHRRLCTVSTTSQMSAGLGNCSGPRKSICELLGSTSGNTFSLTFSSTRLGRLRCKIYASTKGIGSVKESEPLTPITNGLLQIPSANAGHMACLGPCLLQAPVSVHTLIVHGRLSDEVQLIITSCPLGPFLCAPSDHTLWPSKHWAIGSTELRSSLQWADEFSAFLLGPGELEYCTLLGHRLHIDLAVYFAALRTLAKFLKGNSCSG